MPVRILARPPVGGGGDTPVFSLGTEALFWLLDFLNGLSIDTASN